MTDVRHVSSGVDIHVTPGLLTGNDTHVEAPAEGEGEEVSRDGDDEWVCRLQGGVHNTRHHQQYTRRRHEQSTTWHDESNQDITHKPKQQRAPVNRKEQTFWIGKIII